MKYLAYVLLVFSLLCIISCNDVIIKAEIHPKFQSFAGTIAVEYQLGTLTVLDQWEDLKAAQFLYIADENNEKKVHLVVNASDYNRIKFHYVINDSIKVTTEEPVEWETIIKHIDSFPSVRWTQKDSVTIAEKNQVTITPGGTQPLEPEEKAEENKL